MIVDRCCSRSPPPAQEPPAPPPNPANADYHFRYLNRLDPGAGLAPDGERASLSQGQRHRRAARIPPSTDTVTIHYVGRFIDGTEFDSSVARGEPATFPLPRLIRGWQEGVPLMGVGDRYEFAIPYNLAYGYAGRGPIPGGATLLFTIDLIAIAPPAIDAGRTRMVDGRFTDALLQAMLYPAAARKDAMRTGRLSISRGHQLQERRSRPPPHLTLVPPPAEL